MTIMKKVSVGLGIILLAAGAASTEVEIGDSGYLHATGSNKHVIVWKSRKGDAHGNADT